MNGYYVLLGLAAVFAVTAMVEGGCSETSLCCRGKKNTCKVPGERMNGKSNKTCFCDESCPFMGDCCTDFHDTCKAVDCVVGEWQPYGKCSVSCGVGFKQRNREVIQEPMYGGKGCGHFIEKLYCTGEGCKYPRHSMGHLEIRETGKIIPAEFGSWRSSKLYDPYKDIRRNLFNHYGANDIIHRPAEMERPTYCATFEVSIAKGSCDAAGLGAGQTVCVECQPFAMKKSLGVRCSGHGVFMKESRWNAVTVPGCHGKWVMKTRHQDCSCPAGKSNSFILI